MMRFAILFVLGALLLPANAIGQGEADPPDVDALTAEVMDGWHHLEGWWLGTEDRSAFENVVATTATVQPSDLPPRNEADRKGGAKLPGGFAVWNWNPSSPTSEPARGREPVLRELQSLRTAAGEKVIRVKFKVVKIVPNAAGDTLETGTLVEILGSSGDALLELHAHFDASWHKGDTGWLLTSLHMSQYKETVLARSGSGLVDRTGGVLPPALQRDPDLVQDVFAWRHRIEAALQPDNFAQNGVSVADLNGDGREDLYLCQIGGLRNRLFLRQPDGTLEDHSEESGLAIRDNTSSALFLDYDNDGDQDASLATVAGVLIYENDGKGVFILRTRFEKLRHGMGQAASDFDHDGDLDLYLCQYYAGDSDEGETRGRIPIPFPVFDARNGGPNALLRNDGSWKFSDVTAATGLDVDNNGFSYEALWEDFDNDGDEDLSVVNDFGRTVYYRNDGGRFTAASAESGFAWSAFGMGITAADYNCDGWMDLHISNMFSSAGNRLATQSWFQQDEDPAVRRAFLQLAAGNTLYLNRKGARFEEVAEKQGVAMGRWSWASVSPDLNNDGWEDLLVANGFVTGSDLDDL